MKIADLGRSHEVELRNGSFLLVFVREWNDRLQKVTPPSMHFTYVVKLQIRSFSQNSREETEVLWQCLASFEEKNKCLEGGVLEFIPARFAHRQILYEK